MSNFHEYRNLLIHLHNWHLAHTQEETKTDPQWSDLMEKINYLEENHLSAAEINLGDRLTGYLSGYRDGKSNNRKVIEESKEIGEDPSDYEMLALLQTHRHELYEQGFDDYSYDVEKLDDEIEDLKGTISSQDSEVYEAYLTGFLHARDGRTCDPIS